MSTRRNKIDRFFLVSVGLLSLFGFVIFLSASLGYLTRGEDSFGFVAAKQGLSLIIGIAAFFVFSKIKYSGMKKLAFFILVGPIIVNLLLFVPGLALHHGGAARWIDLGFISFQPSELLKIASIIYLAAWIQFVKDRIKTMKQGLLPYVIIMAIMATLLLAQSDTDTLVVIGFTGLVMFIVAGMPFRHVFLAGCLFAVVLFGVIQFRPYAAERVRTYLSGGGDTLGSGYQINQSLIAIGSGQLFGRGFGQSIQKFGYLPQPTDDSVFAVAAEEFGFVGSVTLVVLYLLLAISSFRIASRAPDTFGAFIAIGVAVLIITESFVNMAAMLGLVPLSGLPLLFVSHGGTALIIALAASGMVANVSRYGKA